MLQDHQTPNIQLLDPPTSANREAPGHGVVWELLDAGEEFLLRMITGLFRFIFRKLPQWTWDYCKNAIPTCVKFVRVAFLALILVSVALGPAILASIVTMPHQWLSVFCYAWTGAAVLGSIWGLVYMRVRRRFLMAAIKQAVVAANGEAGEID